MIRGLLNRLGIGRGHGHQPLTQAGTLILMYHRIADESCDPWSLAVSPRHFDEQLRTIRELTRPKRLRDLVASPSHGIDRQPSVIVTFDDGYADNFLVAKPLLERYDVPATVFVSSGFLDKTIGFWWDELERMLLEPGTLPEHCSIAIGGTRYEQALGQARHYTADEQRQYATWRAWDPPPTSRHLLYRALWERLHPLQSAERQSTLDEIGRWAGFRASPSTRRPLTRAELIRLAADRLVEIGSHTVTHTSLGTLPRSAQCRELRESKADLERTLTGPVVSLSYPYGRPADYTAESVVLARETGYACACAGSGGVVGSSTDRYQLPRVHVEDWDGDQFASRLVAWFRARKAA